MSEISAGTVDTEVDDGVFLIALNRPEKRNALTPEMREQLVEAYLRLDQDDALRVGVLHARGPQFTAGIDLPRFAPLLASGEHLARVDPIDIYGLRSRCRKPIVCAVRGITFTFGIELMLAADVVVAGSDCRFAQLEPRRGLMPTAGATLRYVERAGWGNAMLHLLTGQEFGAAEAHRLGLVQEVVEPDEVLARATEIARLIAANAPLAVQAIKANADLYARQGQDAAVAAFAEAQTHLSNSADAAEGLRAFTERRPPKFTGS